MNNDKTEQQRILRNLKKTELLELLIEENNENERLYKLLQEQKGSEDTGNGAQGPVDLDESEEAVSPDDTSPEKVKGLQAWKNVLKTENLKEELQRIRYIEKYRSTIRSTVSILITVAALAILVANFLVPAFQIYGNSMTPTLSEGEIVLALKGDDYEIGQLIAFYYNNKILVKRMIAKAGEWVDIDQDGNVFVNNVAIDEPYLTEKAFGECDLELPYQVPESRIFVMGDHRTVSVDSRNTAIGCVAEEQIVGKIVFCIWPLSDFGPVN
jgi:signal peptidase I